MGFDLDKSKNLYEQAKNFVEWIAEEIIRKKNWLARVLLSGVALFILFNPHQWPFQGLLLPLFPQSKPPNWYTPAFWSLIAAIFIIAVIVAARAKREPAEHPELKLSAIKGLLPFGYEDAEVFAHLQRDQNLKECLQAIGDQHWRFGVMSGESGAGKTSFLQAGLWPEMEKRRFRCVYVKFSDLDPFESVKRACLKHLSLSQSATDDADFLSLLRATAEQDRAPIVLLFDQFEQFFVHRKRKSDRAPFVQALARWFAEMQSLPVKILICIRGDFLDRLNELQKAMKYSLSPTQSFRLERFEPDQATEVFCFLAEKENLEYDRKFISEMTRQELADTEDGLISPVDIQVLAWMIAGQPLQDGRAFNRTTFQKLGGVDGLLERYLTRALAVRETEVRRQAAIKVLLALTDLERNARAGALTPEALRQKLGGGISDAELKEAVVWLARSDVRLISPSSESDEEKFELAHERLIPALRRLAGKQLSDADRADQLLDRRANEWLGNGRNSRYLFSWAELRLINKHRRFVTWGKERQAKEELLAASRRRFRLRYAAVGLLILLAVVGWIVQSSNAWQIYSIKSELRGYGNSLSDDRALTEIAQAFVYAGDSQLALQIVERISGDLSKARALSAIVESYITLGESMKDSALLTEAVKMAERISYDLLKANALRAIAESYAKLGDKEKASALLSEAIRSAEQIIKDSSKADALRVIAESYAKLGDKKKASALLSEAIGSAERGNFVNFTIPNELSLIAESIAKLGDKEKAGVLLSEAIKTVERISYDPGATSVLNAIAKSYAKLGETMKDSSLLSEAIKIVEQISRDSYKADALSAIAESYAKLGDKEKASALLSEAMKTAERSSDGLDILSAQSAIAESYAKLGELMNDSALMSEAIKMAKRIDYLDSYASALSAIAKPIAKLSESSNDRTLYDKTFLFIEGLGSDENRDKILTSILASKLAITDVGRLRSLVSNYSSEAGIARALARILMACSHPELIGKEKESEDDNDHSR